MFCSHCGMKIDDGSIFCANCGMKVSFPTVDKRSDNEESGTILVCEKMNWGEICLNSGTWLSTKWVIYADGTIIRKTKYDSCRFRNREARIYTNTTKLDENSFNQLKLWIKDVLPIASTHEGNDGIGWKFTSFNPYGSVACTLAGYIYNDSMFDTLLEIIGENKL